MIMCRPLFLLILITVMSFVFTSYNSYGLGCGRKDYMRELLPNCTFLMLQEHWLLEKQLVKFRAELGHNILLHGISGMEEGSLLYGRPYGGVAIAWKENFKGVVTPIDFESQRVCAITIKTEELDNYILLINIYMPTDTGGQQNITEFQNTLSEISAILQAHETPYVIIGGDTNTDLGRLQSEHRNALLNFVQEEHLSFAMFSNLSQVDYTYESKSNGCRSLIDHFLVSENIFNRMNMYMVKHDGHNLSDHSSLHLGVDMPCSFRENPRKDNSRQDPAWDKAKVEDVDKYRQMLDMLLNEVYLPADAINCKEFLCHDHRDDINKLHNDIIDACLTASEATIPKQCHANSPGVADWNDQVRECRERAIFWHNMWIDNGRPHHGVIADIRRRTRATYHYAVRKAKTHRERSFADKLATKLQNKNSKEFWKEVKKINKGSSPGPNTMDDAEGEEAICKVFANKFKGLYNSVSYNDYEMEELMRDMELEVTSKCCKGTCLEGHSISVHDVECGIKKLKNGKNDSIAGIKSDHFIHGGNRLKVMVSMLLSSMVCHGYCPSEFTKTTVVPIPKNTRKSMTSSENYRGISLSSVLGKILDYIFLHKYSDILSSSDGQFGFKPGLSTATCSTVINEVIEYFNRDNTNVYCMMLDASKAFDRVHYIKLFRLLLKKGLCPLVSRFLASLYTNQIIRVKWGDKLSEEFTARNGVKQGGVLSPVLFSIYLDELLLSLAKSGVGCYLGMVFVGAFAYADDVILLAPTLQALKHLLKVASSYSAEFMITFNGVKSKLIIFGNVGRDDIEVVFEGTVLRPSPHESHLGMIFGPDVMRKRIQGATHDLYKRTNLLLSQFKFASYQVKYQLFKSYCMSLYGYQGWDLSSECMEEIYVAWRKCIRRLLSLPYRTHSNLIPFIVEDLSIQFQVEKRFVKYFETIRTSSNRYLQLCRNIIEGGSRSPLGKSYNFIIAKYGWDRFDFPCQLPMVRDHINGALDDGHIERKAYQIKELMSVRDQQFHLGYRCNLLSREEVDSVIFFLCVN